MSRNKKSIIKKKNNKKLLNNGLLNMNSIIALLKSHNINKYQVEKNSLWYIANEAVIKMPILNITTETLIKKINMQLSDTNECNICYTSLNDACKLLSCPQCLTSICYNCCNKTILYNNCYVCSFCRYTI